jgi:FlaA1/EpsC-like NDP-sugar epimerase
VVGRRPGEKYHEVLIQGYEEVWNQGDYYVLYPEQPWRTIRKKGTKEEPIRYTSEYSPKLSVRDLEELLRKV